MRFAFLLLFAALFAGFSQAASVSVSTDSIEMSSCSAGTVSVFVEGAAPGQVIYFSSHSQEIITVFDATRLIIDANGAKGTQATFTSPACLYGTTQVKLVANVCNAQGTNCQPLDKTVYIHTIPCPDEECNGKETFNTQNNPTYVQSQSCGETGCREVLSKIDFAEIYSPSAKSLEVTRYSAINCIEAGRRCEFDQLSTNDALVATFRVRNTGAAGTFTLQAESLDDALSITPKTTVIDLGRAESTKVSFVIRASDSASTGLHELTLHALSNNVELSKSRWFVQTLKPEQAILTLPAVTAAGIDLQDCRLPQTLNIQAQLENRGSSATDFAVEARVQDGPTIFTRGLRIDAGLAADFPIAIPTSNLRLGDNTILVTAYGKGLVGTAQINIRVARCSGNAVLTLSTPKTNGNDIELTASVFNSGTTPLTSVTAELRGLPNGWKYTATTVDSIAPREAKEVKITVSPSTDEEAKGVTVAAKSNGVEIATAKTDFAKTSGLTGLFIAGLNTDLLLFVIILLCAAGMFYYWHDKNTGGPTKTDAEEVKKRQYIERLRKIREQVNEEGDTVHVTEETEVHSETSHSSDGHDEHGRH